MGRRSPVKREMRRFESCPRSQIFDSLLPVRPTVGRLSLKQNMAVRIRRGQPKCAFCSEVAKLVRHRALNSVMRWFESSPPIQISCGRSSAARTRPCQGRGREFESRRPFQVFGLSSKCGHCTGLKSQQIRFDSVGRRQSIAGIAHRAERLSCKEEVASSSLAPGSKVWPWPNGLGGSLWNCPCEFNSRRPPQFSWGYRSTGGRLACNQQITVRFCVSPPSFGAWESGNPAVLGTAERWFNSSRPDQRNNRQEF